MFGFFLTTDDRATIDALRNHFCVAHVQPVMYLGWEVKISGGVNVTREYLERFLSDNELTYSHIY